jgi:hypothetical protein
LKQLQLIQILRIKELGAVLTAEFGGSGRGVNQAWPMANDGKGGIRQRGYRLSG